MSLWAIVPVKPLREGKSRLAGILVEEKRIILNQTMLETTLKTLSAVAQIDQILVISRDPQVISISQQFGASSILENCQPELNASLDCATQFASAHAASRLLILPADLPLVTEVDIDAFIHQCPKMPGIVIAPDRWQEGTNALLTNPTGIIPYCFGSGSFIRHKAEAEKKGLVVKICERVSFGLDIDLPEDLDYLNRIKNKNYQ
jgi:2-phospho-L-lactate guanylyltransferase